MAAKVVDFEGTALAQAQVVCVACGRGRGRDEREKRGGVAWVVEGEGGEDGFGLFEAGFCGEFGFRGRGLVEEGAVVGMRAGCGGGRRPAAAWRGHGLREDTGRVGRRGGRRNGWVVARAGVGVDFGLDNAVKPGETVADYTVAGVGEN